MTPFFIKHKYYMKKTYIEEAQEVYNLNSATLL